jgi:hypothetical protein
MAPNRNVARRASRSERRPSWIEDAIREAVDHKRDALQAWRLRIEPFGPQLLPTHAASSGCRSDAGDCFQTGR